MFSSRRNRTKRTCLSGSRKKAISRFLQEKLARFKTIDPFGIPNSDSVLEHLSSLNIRGAFSVYVDNLCYSLPHAQVMKCIKGFHWWYFTRSPLSFFLFREYFCFVARGSGMCMRGSVTLLYAVWTDNYRGSPSFAVEFSAMLTISLYFAILTFTARVLMKLSHYSGSTVRVSPLHTKSLKMTNYSFWT